MEGVPQKRLILSQETLIPIGFALLFVGVIFYCGIMFNKITTIEQVQSQESNTISDHNERLTKIETSYATQYQSLINDIKEIKQDLKDLKNSNMH